MVFATRRFPWCILSAPVVRFAKGRVSFRHRLGCVTQGSRGAWCSLLLGMLGAALCCCLFLVVGARVQRTMCWSPLDARVFDCAVEAWFSDHLALSSEDINSASSCRRLVVSAAPPSPSLHPTWSEPRHARHLLAVSVPR